MPLNKSMGVRRVWDPDSEARESVTEREVEVKEERFEALGTGVGRGWKAPGREEVEG